jgi:putative (di)nucleoside polyphosphate hydrolase
MTNKPYRPSVVAVFKRDQLFLVGKRHKDHNWQFPQGGIEHGESPEQALRREMHEEIGCKNFTIVSSSLEWISYDFPANLDANIARFFRGQRQMWYLCEVTTDEPNLANAIDDEFIELAWWPLTKVQENVIAWKKDSYTQGLALLQPTQSS